MLLQMQDSRNVIVGSKRLRLHMGGCLMNGWIVYDICMQLYTYVALLLNLCIYLNLILLFCTLNHTLKTWEVFLVMLLEIL